VDPTEGLRSQPRDPLPSRRWLRQRLAVHASKAVRPPRQGDGDSRYSRTIACRRRSPTLPRSMTRRPPTRGFFDRASGFPPIYMQVGGDEALLDDSRNREDRARNAASTSASTSSPNNNTPSRWPRAARLKRTMRSAGSLRGHGRCSACRLRRSRDCLVPFTCRWRPTRGPPLGSSGVVHQQRRHLDSLVIDRARHG
jgi:hypothetical protein